MKQRDERGVFLSLIALMLVALLVMAALAVDAGNARQQRQHSKTAADLGALAGAKAVDLTPTVAGICTDANCAAAYYTFGSLSIHLTAAPQRTQTCKDPAVNGGTCWRYISNGKTVDVTTPYSYNGALASADFVHVKVCWTSANAFGKVASLSFFNICGAATAHHDPGTNLTAGLAPVFAPDCGLNEDNFTDDSGKTSLIVPKPIKIGSKFGAHFHSHEDASALNPNAITFTVSPDPRTGTPGSKLLLTRAPVGQALTMTTYNLSHDPPYNPPGLHNGRNVDITWKVPALVVTKTVGGARIGYTATLYAQDTDQLGPPLPAPPNPGVDCGYATFSFTYDGKSSSGCLENNFLNGGVYPSTGIAVPLGHIGAYFSDESPLYDRYYAIHKNDVPPAPPDFLLQFTLDGPGWEDSLGNPRSLTPTMTLTDAAKGTKPWATDTYNTQIDFKLPGPSLFAPNAVYTVYLKANDSDQNKAGGDCGIATWTFKVPLGTGSPGSLTLIE